MPQDQQKPRKEGGRRSAEDEAIAKVQRDFIFPGVFFEAKGNKAVRQLPIDPNPIFLLFTSNLTRNNIEEMEFEI